MSRETMQTLNNDTLIGFTEKRGHAWHYRAELQGDEPNHYPGAVPVGDVQRRLFHWDATSRPLFVQLPADVDTATSLSDDGEPVTLSQVPDRQAITRSDTGAVLGIFAEGYQIHQYREWLLGTVSNLLSDTLNVGSAGLLKGGRVAWASVEVPDTMTTPEGVTFRPNLLACTSHDGSLATTFQRVVTNVVCDNTMSAALSERSEKFKVKHSRNSKIKLAEARDALQLLDLTADAFQAEVAELCATTVTDRQWSKFLDAYVTVPEQKGRGQTLAVNKQDTLNRLWRRDARVAPWKGTAWGVVQAVNTYTHHEGIVRGTERAERNMLRAVSGGADKLDSDTLSLLRTVLV